MALNQEGVWFDSNPRKTMTTTEVIRPDEKPVSKNECGHTVARSSLAASSPKGWSRGPAATTPGLHPGNGVTPNNQHRADVSVAVDPHLCLARDARI